MIVNMRNKGKGKMKKEELFIANYLYYLLLFFINKFFFSQKK